MLLSLLACSQTGSIEGVVRDATTGETLIGANVLIGEGVGTVTDIDGKYRIEADHGSYELRVSYVGYEPKTKRVELSGGRLVVDFKLGPITLTEVEIVADVARERETPVAFSNIKPTQIKEELASQDIPMILNSTPGVYATQDGGGDGDARITIRGFSQRNVAVMLDGVPVNDMENGWVYWSNWFGLDVVTRSIQVQRGLSAAKIAVPSVGGTINILTSGTENKKSLTVKQEVANNGFLRSTVGLNSGKLKGGWGITAAGSYKRGDGWVDQTWTEGYFYYLKIAKQMGKHRLSLSGFGSPQEHGQRSFKQYITTFDEGLGRELGVSETISSFQDQGPRFNPHVGYLQRYDESEIQATRTGLKDRDIFNDRKNFYHKPLFTLKDLWQVNDKLYVSNVAYLSIGKGGGQRFSVRHPVRDENGMVDWQSYYDVNTGYYFYDLGVSPVTDPGIDRRFSDTERKSDSYLFSNRNDHFWYGLLTTFSLKVTDKYTLSGGLDFRDYTGSHYREVEDLFGGDYIVDNNEAKREGDIIAFHNDAMVRWGGLFALLEYKLPVFSWFINVAGIYNGYQRVDYMNVEPGQNEARSEWDWREGGSVKAGANYNLNEFNNVFINAGYISKTPRFSNVFDFQNNLFTGIENEKIKAVELGYGYQRSKFATNVNAYYTVWENKPVNSGVTVPDPNGEEDLRANLRGMHARHVGVEVDAAYKVSRKVTIEGLVSLGDWIWNSTDTVTVLDPSGEPALGLDGEVIREPFDARGVHVGNSAQSQVSGSIRYEPMKGLYFKIRPTHFARHYAEFDPFSLKNGNEGKESWQVPAYTIVDAHAGYRFELGKTKCSIRGSVLNVLDELYISDAQNNDSNLEPMSPANFDAASAGIYLGLGRRWNVSLAIEL